ncbi:MAG: hypothetical protein QNJ41_14545 [Xenococcaceae cyanobacterium MO_188.B32]|nr:hypothetical protein [Xenococcaceae cyanobacterium MO_188.B32]
MTNPTIQVDIAEILKDLQSGQKEILKEISDIKVSLETVKGDIKALDTKVEQLDKRVANQEFLNRGVFIGLLLALLGGVVNFFGWIPKS